MVYTVTKSLLQNQSLIDINQSENEGHTHIFISTSIFDTFPELCSLVLVFYLHSSLHNKKHNINMPTILNTRKRKQIAPQAAHNLL